MDSENKKTIEIVGYDNTNAIGKGYGDRLQSRQVDLLDFKSSLTTFMEKIDDVFSNIKSDIQDTYELDEIEAKIEISASGEIRLIGKLEAGASGGLTLKYKRKDTSCRNA